MSFGENLKAIRKKRGVTQEQLAQTLNVSRQSISKWESNASYPESEKLILIAKELDVSLDYLLLNSKSEDMAELSNDTTIDNKVTLKSNTEGVAVSVPNGKIAITSFNNNSIVQCISVKSSKILAPAKNEPPYLLLGVDKITLLGEHSVILAWYETLDEVQKEIAEISKAIENKKLTYSLKYYSNIEFKGFFGRASRKNDDK